ncbi:MAG TPA: glutaminyl-peptide cyclotransferase [Bacteroidia bacterium]|nr:glutaminyl-peptide cyclotransferase [Bacteroidia bacterium]
MSALLLFLASCGGGVRKNDGKDPVMGIPLQIAIETAQSKSYACGDTVPLSISVQKPSAQSDTLFLKADGQIIFRELVRLPYHYLWHSDTSGPGLHTLEASLSGGKTDVASVSVMLVSDIVPVQYTYEVVKTYPHDAHSYTQGLQYLQGFLYEGSGLYEHSRLRKVELQTGKVLKETKLAPEYFGEGITLFNSHIYQLTWKSGIGFVYDTSSFQEIGRFNYGTEGWGLTTDGTKLIMSDGSSTLFFFDKNFSFLGKVQVVDNKGPVDMLNELEYIDGLVFANVYQSNRIVQINPHNGKITGSMQMEGLLPRKDYVDDTDVLNGIAWDESGKRLFVTGKNWPRLFEIKLKRSSGRPRA